MVNSPLAMTTKTQSNKGNKADPVSRDGGVMIREEKESYFSVNYSEGNFSQLRKHYVFSRPVSGQLLMEGMPRSATGVGEGQKEIKSESKEVKSERSINNDPGGWILPLIPPFLLSSPANTKWILKNTAFRNHTKSFSTRTWI